MMLILMCSKAINVTTCLEGDIRLVNGQNQFEGSSVEILSEWSSSVGKYPTAV